MGWESKSWDYFSFGTLLIIPILVGIYHGLKHRSANSSSYAFVFGRKEIHPWQAIFSIGTLSAAPVLLMVISELQFGTASALIPWILYPIGFLLGFIVVVTLFVPIFHYARSPSVFGYIDERYRSRALKILVVTVYLMSTVLYNVVITTLVSELASKSLPMPKWIIAILFITIASVPGLLGGLNGVLDLCLYNAPLGQIIPITAFVAVGFTKLTPIATAGSSADNFIFDGAVIDIEDVNLWLIIPFAFLSTIQFFGASQNVYQSFTPAVTQKRARLALIFSLPVILILFALTFIMLVLIRQFLANCGPLGLASESISDIDNPWHNIHLLINFVWDETPGLTGLIVCALSTFGICILASNFLSVSTVLWEEALSGLLNNNSQARRQILAIQILLSSYATLIAALTASFFLLVPQAWIHAKTILLVTNSVLAPLTAVYVAGIFMPCSNSKGATTGFLVGLSLMVCLSGGFVYNSHQQINHPFVGEKTSSFRCNNGLVNGTKNGTTEQQHIATPTATSVYYYSNNNLTTTGEEDADYDTTRQPKLFPTINTPVIPSTTDPPLLIIIQSTLSSKTPTTTNTTASSVTTKTSFHIDDLTTTTKTEPPNSFIPTTTGGIESITTAQFSSNSTENNDEYYAIEDYWTTAEDDDSEDYVFTNDTSDIIMTPTTNDTGGIDIFGLPILPQFLRSFSDQYDSNQKNSSAEGTMTIPSFLQIIIRLSPLMHPIVGFAVSIVLILLISIITGGNDIYALDWNLVYWTCNDCTQRLRFRVKKDHQRRAGKDNGGNGAATSGGGKRRNRNRGVKSPYISSESFRYARQAPYSDSNYRNPQVKQLGVDGNTLEGADENENTMEINTNTNSTNVGGVGGHVNQSNKDSSNFMQTRLVDNPADKQDFFSTLRPYTEVL